MNLDYVLKVIDDTLTERVGVLEEAGDKCYSKVWSELATYRGLIIQKLLTGQAESDEWVAGEIAKLQDELLELKDQIQEAEWGDDA